MHECEASELVLLQNGKRQRRCWCGKRYTYDGQFALQEYGS
jgi:hypothetical protein